MHNDLAVLFKELTQNLAGAPSNALLVGLFREAAPRRMKTNVWARLRGQKEQLTIQVQHAAAGLYQLTWCHLQHRCCAHICYCWLCCQCIFISMYTTFNNFHTAVHGLGTKGGQ